MKFLPLCANRLSQRVFQVFLRLCLPCLLVFLVFSSAQGQEVIKLKPDEPVTFSITPGEEKTFVIELKKDEFAEIFLDDTRTAAALSIALYDPLGKDLLKDADYWIGNSIFFIAQMSGEYRFTIELDKEEKTESQQKIFYTKTLKLPSKTDEEKTRNINGYNIRILNSSKEEESVLLIEKDGQPKSVLRARYVSGPEGFYFTDDASDRSARLIKSTLDKTGDGTPDILIEYYSGGAHCCFTYMFFELREPIRSILVDTGDARLTAIAKNPKGGLRFRTADNTFAYWLTSYSQSPMPIVILEFRNGVLHPNLDLMKKPAPPLARLRRKAEATKRKISLEPYKGFEKTEFGHFEVAFWGEMLDLLYSGHEELAWKYFDWVWPAKKKGKELFRKDFMQRLSESKFWKMIQEEKQNKLSNKEVSLKKK